jgi:hypothetical protein
MNASQAIASHLTSNQNKGLIWKLLTDSGAFQSIPDQKAGLVKGDFDNKVQTIANQISPNDSLVNLNKRIISEMMVAMSKYNAPADIPLPIYNNSDLLQQRQKVFQNELATKQNEFELLNHVKKPEKIDFSDTLDAPIGSEMDKMLAEQIALREKQLYSVLESQDKSAASKWLQNTQAQAQSQAPTFDLQKNDAPNIKLKIGEKIDIDEKVALKIKKVNFQMETQPDPQIDTDKFMSLLKRKEPSNNSSMDINAMLREILDKQNQILALLTKT